MTGNVIGNASGMTTKKKSPKREVTNRVFPDAESKRKKRGSTQTRDKAVFIKNLTAAVQRYMQATKSTVEQIEFLAGLGKGTLTKWMNPETATTHLGTGLINLSIVLGVNASSWWDKMEYVSDPPKKDEHPLETALVEGFRNIARNPQKTPLAVKFVEDNS